MQYFYIKRGSTLPTLRMELIEDGRHDYRKFYDSIQNCSITFTMVNIDTNITKVAKAPCYIKLKEDGGCVEKYVICYDWKERDTKDVGTYKGTFDITFNPIKSDETEYPTGKLIIPIREELTIIILP